MKDKAIKYLSNSPLLHMGMIEPINRNIADILYAESDGVLIREKKSGAYMISVDDPQRGKDILEIISAGALFTAHQKDMAAYIADKFKLHESLECVQAVYTDHIKLNINKDIQIKQLEPLHKDVVLEHYNKLSEHEIIELLNTGCIFGGYKNGVLIGFVGTHLEGSLGLLEIFPEYRRLGYGAILESYVVNQMLDQGFVPFGQIEVNNKNSIALQKKLGFKISENSLYWIF
ncbi:MAG: GCN5-related N-acetyltransferase [Herbinix sp.]|jgi:GNAT superfamily N-acetyltransferase|nr:GCN5-related N-acetyltransferase [Herbinix sp.]